MVRGNVPMQPETKCSAHSKTEADIQPHALTSALRWVKGERMKTSWINWKIWHRKKWRNFFKKSSKTRVFSHRASSVRSDWTNYELSLTNDGWTLARLWGGGLQKHAQKQQITHTRMHTRMHTKHVREVCARRSLIHFKRRENCFQFGRTLFKACEVSITPADQKKNVKENHPISLKRRQAGGGKKTTPKKQNKTKNTRGPNYQ